MRVLIWALWLLPVLAAPVSAGSFDTAAKAAILMDARSGDVLFAKNSDQPLPPASMSKLMTAFMVFERLEQGTLRLEDELPVSERAWRMGGSKMFVGIGSRVKVSDLLRGIIVQSGNDACIVVAESLAGSEEAFAEQMTERGAEIGLTNSHFMNATGWPHDEHMMSVRDLAAIASMIISRFPEYYELYSIREFEYNEINQYNRNPLLRRNVPGVDGMKTGYTEDAGYGLVASADRDGRRLILVVAGLETPGQRSTEAERLLEYGFREFEQYRIYNAGDVVDQAAVWLGADDTVDLVAGDDVWVTLDREARQSLQARILYDEPVASPVTKGQAIGQVEISAPSIETRYVPLVAGADVGEAGPVNRALGALSYLVFGSG